VSGNIGEEYKKLKRRSAQLLQWYFPGLCIPLVRFMKQL